MESNNEIWKDIPNVANYQASNLGNIRSVFGGKTKVLTPFSNVSGDTPEKRKGYLCVSLSENGNKVYKTVHSLVCQAWHEKPTNKGDKLQVNHKDENKWNNRADNLEWVTPSENCLYGSKPQKMRKAKIKMLVGFKNDEKEPYTWESISECCSALNTYHNKLDCAINASIDPSEPEKQFKDIQGNYWAIYSVWASYDSEGNLKWESPEKRKNNGLKKPYEWLDEKPTRVISNNEMVVAELPKDKWGKVIQAEPLPLPFQQKD
ncbi:MAG: NUMOD4 motif-containing HNH endonuclease [Bacteroidales bacterium]|nr:NUMOD4 motif-containing HNH endonuclease [Bacteroidales bacterium]